jgi:hypothetical protein
VRRAVMSVEIANQYRTDSLYDNAALAVRITPGAVRPIECLLILDTMILCRAVVGFSADRLLTPVTVLAPAYVMRVLSPAWHA